MPSFPFTTGELHLPHTRLPVKDIRLDVAVGSDTTATAPASVAEFLNGSIQVTGELALDCAPEPEISLEELLQQLGADRSAVDSNAVRFTSEGGFAL
jgi:hypothetical protein